MRSSLPRAASPCTALPRVRAGGEEHCRDTHARLLTHTHTRTQAHAHAHLTHLTARSHLRARVWVGMRASPAGAIARAPATRCAHTNGRSFCSLTHIHTQTHPLGTHTYVTNRAGQKRHVCVRRMRAHGRRTCTRIPAARVCCLSMHTHQHAHLTRICTRTHTRETWASEDTRVPTRADERTCLRVYAPIHTRTRPCHAPLPAERSATDATRNQSWRTQVMGSVPYVSTGERSRWCVRVKAAPCAAFAASVATALAPSPPASPHQPIYQCHTVAHGGRAARACARPG